MPSVELVSRTRNSLTCRAVDLPSNAAGVNWYIGTTSAATASFVTSWDGVYNGATAAYTFSGLQPDTLYYVKALAYDAYQGRIDPPFDDSFRTLLNATRPEDWAWESTVSSGSPINMTAAEFNRFVDRVFAFAAYKNVSLGSASSYYVTARTDMLASEVNAVRALISAMSPPTALPSAASRSSAITAAFFNGLKNSLNSIT